MHRERLLLGVLVLYIGIVSPVLNADVDVPDDETLIKNHMVFVEPKNVLISKENPAETFLLPYRERRGAWSFMAGADYSGYEPIHYEPTFFNQNYRTVYGHPDAGLIEGQFTFKRNMAFGSIGGTIASGGFSNTNSGAFNSVLNYTIVEAGVSYFMDSLTPEPYVVPYVTAGGYTVIYKESLDGNILNGTTQLAPYFTAGVAFGLNWIDPNSARNAFQEGGLNSTFIYAEGRTLIKSSAAKDPDFSNSIDWAVGLRLEM